ncbi:protein NRT1/ PTR FAMILY 4.5-like [Cucumis melo var. makuwa]|uniref:Protein NRT1/ PTR FAMILY 4.5-like n=2 Tax=Cucumis melo var. makuwa TaxID=1194695 RepID=A0A5A7ULM1_CUCMM|nr:protein NRT1/ PTR FAMILY 4.5-like [Cucumis melo var. makuwa]
MGTEEKDIKVVDPKDEGKGGFRATMFIFGLLTFESMGFVANMTSLVQYFLFVMHFDLETAANTLTNFMGSAFLLSLLGGFLSDTYINRLTTCLIFGFLEVIALILITVQAYSHDLLPSPLCPKDCVKGRIAFVFYTSLYLLAIGSGGVRGALPALGADQFNQKDPKEAKALGTFFNYMLLSVVLGAAVGVTVIVWVAVNKAWYWGFFISALAALVGFIIFAIGKPFYRIQVPGQSPILRVIQVIVVAIKNRRLRLPDTPNELYEISDKVYMDSIHYKIVHTNQLRFLDKAAIVPKDIEPQPWNVCSVTQVEEVKIITRMVPIFISTIIMNTCLAQLQTFSVEQGNTIIMDKSLGHFQFPAPSIPVIPLVFMAFLIPLYEFVFVPFARKITHHPSGITQLQRVGVGLVLSAIAMAVAGLVEVKRRHQAIKHPDEPISLFWLAFQYGIFGIADMFTLVGLLEFFYKEAPVGMRSLSTSFTFLSLALGYYLSSIFVNIVNKVTRNITPSKRGWVEGLIPEDLNHNNLNLFYWFLAILSVLNFFHYLYWASWYKYKTEEPIEELNSRGGETTKEPIAELNSKEGETMTKEPIAELNKQGEEIKEPTAELNGRGEGETKEPNVELNGGRETKEPITESNERGGDDVPILHKEGNGEDAKTHHSEEKESNL